MRKLAVTLLAFGLAVSARAEEAEEVEEVGDNVVILEDLNFKIAIPPDSMDWNMEEVGEAQKRAGCLAHFSTIFAEFDNGSQADVWVYAYPMTDFDARKKLDQIIAKWQNVFEGSIENVHDRKSEMIKVGKDDRVQDALVTSVKGIRVTFQLHRSYLVTRMGRHMYFIVIDRFMKAIGDDDLEEELNWIIGSFDFLKKEKLQKHKDGKKSQKKAKRIGGVAKDSSDDIDPKLLLSRVIEDDFWKFKCVKPEGLVEQKPDKNDLARGVRYKFMRNNRSGYVLVEISVQTKKKARYTIEKLADQAAKVFTERQKKAKEPVIDAKYKKHFPLAKKAIKLELVGRTTSVNKETWYFAQCENDRQYTLRIYANRGGDRAFADELEEFVKSFTPKKK
ncbi:MAG: hypothetical protein V3T86_08215 [Planctomycetota bacterium]